MPPRCVCVVALETIVAFLIFQGPLDLFNSSNTVYVRQSFLIVSAMSLQRTIYSFVCSLPVRLISPLGSV